MDHQSLIESIYKRLLKEATLSEFDTSGMAAFVDESGNSKIAVVYKIDAIDAFEDTTSQIDLSAIVGFVKIAPPRGAPCRGAWQVKAIVGPGKLVYGLAYAMSPTGVIVPDRSEVSDSASAAWKGYAAKTDPKNILPLDDADHPKSGTDKYHDKYHTEDPSDDCYTAHAEDHLNAAYRGPGGESELIDRLMDSHMTLKNKMKQRGVDIAKLEDAIIDAGYNKFDSAR
jgi:hypothetical protein